MTRPHPHGVMDCVKDEDCRLAKRAAEGDEHAFRGLVDRHYDACLRFATLQMGNVPDAEDVVQDTFVRAHGSLGRYDDKGQFRAWLFRILVNRCRSLMEKRTRRKTLLEQSYVEERSWTTLAQPLDPSPWRPEIERALGKLPSDQREAFLLKFVEEWSYEQMAALTGAGVSALKMRVTRARDRLRTDLEVVE